MVDQGERFACLTAYDATTARHLERAGIPLLLTGDTAAEVVLGLPGTIHAPLDFLIMITAAVKRGAPNTFVMGDMPFLSYQCDEADGIRNAGRFLTEGMADAVKLEGGEKFFEIITFLIKKKINVMGHIGLLPQKHNGKYPVYGRKKNEEKKILDDLSSLEKAGVFSIVIECTVESIVKKLMKKSNTPIIGIGATSDCDGQVLVAEDLLGLTDFNAKFLKKYSNLDVIISRAFEKFSSDVVKRKFPQKKNYYK